LYSLIINTDCNAPLSEKEKGWNNESNTNGTNQLVEKSGRTQRDYVYDVYVPASLISYRYIVPSWNR